MLRKDVTDWFELESDRPYMLMVANVRKYRCHAMTADEAALFGIEKLKVVRSEIPAVTHVDYSACKPYTQIPIRCSIDCSIDLRRKPAAEYWSTLVSTFAPSHCVRARRCVPPWATNLS